MRLARSAFPTVVSASQRMHTYYRFRGLPRRSLGEYGPSIVASALGPVDDWIVILVRLSDSDGLLHQPRARCVRSVNSTHGDDHPLCRHFPTIDEPSRGCSGDPTPPGLLWGTAIAPHTVSFRSTYSPLSSASQCFTRCHSSALPLSYLPIVVAVVQAKMALYRTFAGVAIAAVIFARAASAEETCISFGMDFQNGGSYFQNSLSQESFTFVSQFERKTPGSS